MDVIIKLSDEQVKALKMLDLTNETQDICEKAAAASIRGKFKYFSEKAEHEAERSFEWAQEHGARFDVEKQEFVAHFMEGIRALLNKL